MARHPRVALTGHPLHIIQRGNNRSACFFAETDFRFYLDCLGEAAQRHGCAVHAYVLMPNHVHLLATPNRADAASLMMQQLGRRYVRVTNSRHQRSGTLWEGRFRASVVDTERYLLTCHRYIELNPVRAGMVACPEDYRWSSHLHCAAGRRDPLLTAHDCYLRLGADPVERQVAFRALFRDHLDEAALAHIRATVNQGWPLGSERYRREVEEVLRRRARPLRRGRRGKREGQLEGVDEALFD